MTSEKKQDSLKQKKNNKVSTKQSLTLKPPTSGLNTKGGPFNLEPESFDSSSDE